MKYRLPYQYLVTNWVEVEADSIKKAIEVAENVEFNYRDGEYVDGSANLNITCPFEIDRELSNIYPIESIKEILKSKERELSEVAKVLKSAISKEIVKDVLSSESIFESIKNEIKDSISAFPMKFDFYFDGYYEWGEALIFTMADESQKAIWFNKSVEFDIENYRAKNIHILDFIEEVMAEDEVEAMDEKLKTEFSRIASSVPVEYWDKEEKVR